MHELHHQVVIPPASVTLLLLAACITCRPQHTALPRLDQTPSPALQAAAATHPLCLHPDPGHTSISCRTRMPPQSAASLCCCGLCGDGIVLLQHLNGLLHLCVCVGGQAKKTAAVESVGSLSALSQPECDGRHKQLLPCVVVRVLFHCACNLSVGYTPR